ncbi:hypothetical protein KL86CLO1_11683 [uncultured Eubacteriales bacterium]|uniref:Gp28/Gp37-like domain-containing protein n=1 Tax=uncultured Eubacteriales bacterium TaxID=172733 RepID=A0A212JTA4_9FIRM|nr:hypothetical protein KL86CLO1_11683 [uncultured Eubacteriales bacterium]
MTVGIEIRIFDPVAANRPAFGRVGLTTAATGISTTSKLAAPGDFTITIPLGARYADAFLPGRLVLIDRTFWGVIDGRVLEAGEQGQQVTASGRDLKGLTVDRITLPPLVSSVAGTQGYDVVTGTTEACMKHFVDANMVRSADPLRNIPGLLIALDQGRGVQDDKYMSRHDGLSDVLQALGEAAGLGYDIIPDLDNGAYVFDVVQGVDRSGIQSDRPRIVFDISRRTAQAQTYTDSRTDARNIFYATRSGAEYEDEALTMMYVRDGEETQGGIYRREQHLSLSVSTPEAGQEYEELQRAALQEAENYRPAESFTCVILDGRFQYGRDYFLGDTVTAQSREWGVTMHPMVTAMTTEYGETGITHTATFGKAPLNVFGRLRRQIRQGG